MTRSKVEGYFRSTTIIQLVISLKGEGEKLLDIAQEEKAEIIAPEFWFPTD